MNGIGMISWFDYSLPMAERLQMIKDVGFDATELWWKGDDKNKHPEMVRKAGLQIDNIHAPIGNPNCLWLTGSDGDDYQNMLISCVEDCRIHDISTAVIHLVSFEENVAVTDLGLSRIGKVIDAAERKNVKLAFENLTVLEHLDAVFNCFPSPNVGFCWDSGHENWNHPDKDCLSLYGDKLFAVHINDNFGDKDMHALPFDGTVNWDLKIPKLKVCRDIDFFNLESGVNCTYNNRKIYGDLSANDYLALAYKKASNFFHLLQDL